MTHPISLFALQKAMSSFCNTHNCAFTTAMCYDGVDVCAGIKEPCVIDLPSATSRSFLVC